MSAATREASWLGDSEDWGLSSARLGELEAELDDHLHCLQADEGLPATEQVRENLKKPASRRKLAGPHLTDQVYATLNRWPTRREWHELTFLLACFALILLSDWLALRVDRQLSRFEWHLTSIEMEPSASVVWLASVAWVLQAAARAAFYAGFCYTLWRAWQSGWGVMLARVLQLKLIHTMLVVTAVALVGKTLWSTKYESAGYVVSWPAWLTAPVILALTMGIAVAALLIRRGKSWAFALTIALTGLFLYPGGPVPAKEVTVTQPIKIAFTGQHGVYGTWGADADSDPQTIQSTISEMREILDIYKDLQFDIPANRMQYTELHSVMVPGVLDQRGVYTALRDNTDYGYQKLQIIKPTGSYRLLGPVTAPGGGISWLAVPIPLLGIIGLLGLLLLMGGRGLLEFVLYTGLCFAAIGTTLVPYLVCTPHGKIFELSALGVVHSPLPGFEWVLVSPDIDAAWLSIVGGLILSAGVPWLLAGLFLRPRRSTLPVDKQVAQ